MPYSRRLDVEIAFDEIGYHILKRIVNMELPDKLKVAQKIKAFGISLEKKYEEDIHFAEELRNADDLVSA